MGNETNSIQKVAVIATQKTWLEGAAVEQLKTTSQLPGMKYVAGMPDLHPGRGYPVGASFFSENIAYPALVGNDIGCGMSFYQLDLQKHKWSGKKLAEKLGNIDGPLSEDYDDLLAELGYKNHQHKKSLGTIGGGNHFAEVQEIVELYEKEDEKLSTLSKKQLYLLVHSGSRGLGEEVLRSHVDKFGHKGVSGADLDEYMQQHNNALNYAKDNRALITKRMLNAWKVDANIILDIHHNFVEKANIQGVEGYLHRKGATPSNKGLVVIPGSRGDFSYLVRPIQSEIGLLSLAHGAGRKWQRSDCVGKLGSKVRLDDLVRGDIGSTLVCNDKSLLFEEAPQAYKKADSIIEALEHYGLIQVVAKLKPIMTYKTSGGCGC